MRKFEDLSGMKFGKLLVIERDYSRKKVYWKCQCECGNTAVVSSGNLKFGYTRSCGCIAKKRGHDQLFKHGESRVKNNQMYQTWLSMRRRCYDTKCKDYKRYGARGISICNEWADYINFREWSLNNGFSPNLTLDRIDYNGNYTPENCRWADNITQANNRSSNHLVTYNGKTFTVTQLSREAGIPPKTFLYRINAGWDIEHAVKTPVDYRNRLAKLS